MAVPLHAAELRQAWDWSLPDDDHGGYSAIEMSADGRDALVMTDWGRLLDLRIDRGTNGAIIAVVISRVRTVPPLSDREDRPDTEGLAVAANGDVFISVEGKSAVAEYRAPSQAMRRLPDATAFDDLRDNRGLEALAIAPDGALWTLAEARVSDVLPLWIFRGDSWRDGPRLPAAGFGFLPVGLDFDEDGRLYLLERQFLGPFGFRSRLRRFSLNSDSVAKSETLLETEAGQHDNLEGVAIWRDDADRLIATMISDDNFFALQRTELVEYILPD